MKRLFNGFLFGFAILSLGPLVNAQNSGPDPYYRNRDRYVDDRDPRRSYGYGRDQTSVVDRVLSDVNRAASRARLDGHDGRHFDEVFANLQDFQARWARGKFDSGKLDRAIDNLKHLVEADRVRGRDRDMLARDIEDLRQFRSSGGRYGYNPYYRR